MNGLGKGVVVDCLLASPVNCAVDGFSGKDFVVFFAICTIDMWYSNIAELFVT